MIVLATLALGFTTFLFIAGGLILIGFAVYNNGFNRGYDEGHEHGFDLAKGPTLPPIDKDKRGWVS